MNFAPVHRPPSTVSVLAAAAAAVVGSLAADVILVAMGTAIFPATRNYAHFRFSDYAKLTIIGVLIACVAWPVVTRISASPRWLFLRLAIMVTLFLWLPEIYILYQGQAASAVAVLIVMHLAVALIITYNCLVLIAEVKPPAAPNQPAG